LALASAGTEVPRLLLSRRGIENLLDVQAALKWATEVVRDLETPLEPLQAKMEISLQKNGRGGPAVKEWVDMVELYNKALTAAKGMVSTCTACCPP
jgi:hypothetical protein